LPSSTVTCTWPADATLPIRLSTWFGVMTSRLTLGPKKRACPGYRTMFPGALSHSADFGFSGGAIQLVLWAMVQPRMLLLRRRLHLPTAAAAPCQPRML